MTNKNYRVSNTYAITASLSDLNKGPTHIVFKFRDGTEAIWKTGGDMQEFIDKVQEYHVLQKKLDKAMEFIENMELVPNYKGIMYRGVSIDGHHSFLKEIENIKD